MRITVALGLWLSAACAAAPLKFAPEAPQLGRVIALETHEGRVLAGTDHGLMVRGADGTWSAYPGSAQLPDPLVLSIAGDPKSGDVWVGTMKGLARLSAGRAEVWTQFNSGLANDVVYSVALQPPYLWAGTAAGLSRFDPATGRWWIFNEKNTPMRENWNYSVAIAPDRVWAGIWGSGVLEYYISEDRWKLYQDADGEAEVMLLKDAGPVHNVTSAVAADGNVIWQASYFGLSRYDGRRWKNYLTKDSGLPSNFVTFVKVKDHVVYACTDNGLGTFDGRRWEAYLPEVHVLAVTFNGDAVYAGTYEGLQVGRREGGSR